MVDNIFDVVVIGGGPGGYVAAIKAAQLGMKVACVEKRAQLGGTCLNVGCIPSKALLSASEKYESAKHHLQDFGVVCKSVELKLPAMMGHKDQVVKANTDGIAFLFKKNGIQHIQGHGKLLGQGKIEVEAEGGKKSTIEARNIIIATGSVPVSLPGVGIDEERIVTSTGGLSLPEVPKEMVVIGGGYIGLEMGTVWQRLGAKVTVVEYLDRILPGMDSDIAKQMQKILAKQGLEFMLSTKVMKAERRGKKVTLNISQVAGGKASEIEADVVLVAVGRKPCTENLGLVSAGVMLDEKGRIRTNEHFATTAPNIYAIGDVIAGPMLAHKAEEEGVALAEMLAGQKPHIRYDLIPGVVYTAPEVASIGKSEEDLKAANIEYRVGKFPFSANGRARAIGATDGFVKILADAKTDKILGCHIIGHEAGALIHELAIAMEFSASSEDIARTCHAHPTLNEVIKEAAMAVTGKPLHM
ncbi:MAG: dihydrolipoyl dehydrogenase [Alphaproteobacteria bacterium]